MRAIEAGVELDDPPEWAVLERSLLDLLSESIDPVLERYVDGDGHIRWPSTGGYDDAFEGFSNWPLLYVLGGEERALEASIEQWEAVTEQFARDGPGTAHVDGVEEFPASLDWMHQGEGHQLFYYVCLAAPDHDRFRERARRFANLYLPGGDVDNYDPERRQIRAPCTGSEGPSVPVDGPWGYAEWKEWYGLPFQDVEGVETVDDLRDPGNAERMGAVLEERWRGDTAVNLAATSLLTNAYLLTGEDQYREWVLEYVDAWEERTDRNEGVIPDSVGPSGEIGEFLDGRWYGGYYGWTWPHGWLFVGESAIAAGENATLLDGGEDHLEMARTTMDALASAAIEREDTLFVPYKYGEEGTLDFQPLGEEYVLRAADGTVLQRDGWYEFQPMDAEYPVHVWQASMREDDRDRIDRLADRARGAPDSVLPGNKKDLAGNDAAWAAYLGGEYPGYPAEILSHAHEQAYERLARIREDDPEFVPEGDEYLNLRSPVDVEGLVQCTLGGPMTLYNGGLLQGRVRHFDPDRGRPGLPEDVAALVSGLDADATELELVNLGAESRTVAVQAGVYGEHQFETVTYTAPGDERHGVEVGDRAVEVTLPAGTRTTLAMETRRHVNEPGYAPPWDR
jgi:hypothetical protein